MDYSVRSRFVQMATILKNLTQIFEEDRTLLGLAGAYTVGALGHWPRLIGGILPEPGHRI